MRTIRMFVVVGLVWGLASQCEAQQSRDLRNILRRLQEELETLAVEDDSDPRTSPIGASRVAVTPMEDEPLVVRLYDLSDLFSLAPPYPAQQLADLQQSARPLFPAPPMIAAPTGSGFGGAVGGMGGMGFGGLGGGGMFSVGSPSASSAGAAGAASSGGVSTSGGSRRPSPKCGPRSVN